MKRYGVDTIAAQATPVGRSGIGIIRVSGPKVQKIAEEVLHQKPKPREANFCKFFAKDNKILDIGIALFFPNPCSFTGEDVLELHSHGSQVVMEVLLQRVLELGARIARPGEFTERAYLNGKLDLAQAEAVIDLINAGTFQAAQSAARSLQGEFSQEINQMMSSLTALRKQVEATIDFAEEDDIAALSEGSFGQEIVKLLKKISELKKGAEQGIVLREGVTVVITGNTNVGKSSLFNYLGGQETAIVTAVPGTTRDVLRSWIQLDGLPINLLDTAGLRDNPDVIEEEGIRRAKEEIKRADHILLMEDVTTSNRNPRELTAKFLGEVPAHRHLTVLYNKIDLTGEEAKFIKEDGFACIYLSLKEQRGVELLKKHLKECAGIDDVDSAFCARRGHLASLNLAEECLQRMRDRLSDMSHSVLIAEELKKAQEVLGEIVGGSRVTPDDILQEIFSEFCIGK